MGAQTLPEARPSFGLVILNEYTEASPAFPAIPEPIILPMIGHKEPTIVSMDEFRQQLDLQAIINARREQIETEYSVKIPPRQFDSIMDEFSWLRLAHHALWRVSVEFTCDGGWGRHEWILTRSFDQLVKLLADYRVVPKSAPTV